MASVPISHSCVCERFMYSQDRSTDFPATEKGRPIVGTYINRSKTHECGYWDYGHAVPFLGILFEFSVLCLCSVVTFENVRNSKNVIILLNFGLLSEKSNFEKLSTCVFFMIKITLTTTTVWWSVEENVNNDDAVLIMGHSLKVKAERKSLAFFFHWTLQLYHVHGLQ